MGKEAGRAVESGASLCGCVGGEAFFEFRPRKIFEKIRPTDRRGHVSRLAFFFSQSRDACMSSGFADQRLPRRTCTRFLVHVASWRLVFPSAMKGDGGLLDSIRALGGLGRRGGRGCPRPRWLFNSALRTPLVEETALTAERNASCPTYPVRRPVSSVAIGDPDLVTNAAVWLQVLYAQQYQTSSTKFEKHDAPVFFRLNPHLDYLKDNCCLEAERAAIARGPETL